MKILRVLTGIHAGAQLKLDSISLRLGADDEADIRISDWHEPSVLLTFDSQGVVKLEQIAQASNQDLDAPADTTNMLVAPITLNDLKPIKMGGIVFCVGDENASWPDDAALLSLLTQSAQTTQAAAWFSPRLQRLLVYAVSLIIGASLITASVIWKARRDAQREYQAKVNTPANQIKRSLANAGIQGIEIGTRGDLVILRGIIASTAEDIVVRHLIDQVSGTGSSIAPNYDVASNIEQNIMEFLGIPGIKVKYAGAGVFQIVGTVPNLSQAQQALERLRPDLSTNIKRIDCLLTEAAPADATTRYSTFMSSSEVRFVVTPDGVKHLYPSDE